MILGFSVTPAVMPEVSIDSRIQCYVCSNARGNYMILGFSVTSAAMPKVIIDSRI